MFPLSVLLSKFIRKGTLSVIDAAGKTHRFGGAEPGLTVTMKLDDAALYKWYAVVSGLVAEGISGAVFDQSEPASTGHAVAQCYRNRVAGLEALPAIQPDRQGAGEYRAPLRYR
jgi:hypothetical protein